MSRDYSFSIPCVFSLSTNVQITLTSLDGGIRRRCVGTEWVVQFVANPAEPHQRKRHSERVKEAPFWTTLRRAGVLFLTFAAAKTFFANGRDGLKPLPDKVVTATESVLADALTERVVAFVATLPTAPAASGTVHRGAFMLALKAHMMGKGLETSESELKKAADSVVCFKIRSGSRDCVQALKGSRWIKLGWSTVVVLFNSSLNQWNSFGSAAHRRGASCSYGAQIPSQWHFGRMRNALWPTSI